MPLFSDTKYEADSGSIHKLRLQPKILAAAGTPPTGDVDSDILPKVSKSNGEYGIRPRYVRGSTIIGTSPNDFRKYIKVPVLTPTAFASAGFQLNASITVDSVAYTIISRFPEDY